MTRAGFRLSWVTHECGGRVDSPGEIRSGHKGQDINTRNVVDTTSLMTWNFEFGLVTIMSLDRVG